MNKSSLIAKSAALAIWTLVLLATPERGHATAVQFSIGGDNTAASIQATVDSFRAAVGNPNNGNNAGTTGGRREINWDGGGGVSTPAPGGTPFNVFLNNRGAQFTTPGTGFQQAVPGSDFGNATYSTTFGVFSPLRDFSPIGSNITEGRFFIPGTNGAVAASVSAFGAIFTDVDLANTTKIEYFDPLGNLLTSVFVPVGTTANASFSFAGVVFNAGEQIARIRITTGNSALGPSDGAGVDVVIMDDFIFGEPIRLPEPGTALLLLVGLLPLVRFVRRR
jgi:hypothetical protein